MRRLLLMAGLLWCVLCCCRAEGGWTEDGWAALRADLASDTALPVPAEHRILPAPAPQVPEGQALTLLLMGTDAPDVKENFGRTDLLLLCRLDFEKGSIRLLSLPEEATVSLPSLPGRIMLRHVNCFGGPLLTLQTVNGALGVSASRYCAVNFAVFQDIVDALGGVALNLTESEALALGVPPGDRMLTGEEALRYVRLRRQGDGSGRAMALLEAVANQLSRQEGIGNAYRLMDLMLPRLDTNLSTKNLMDAAVSFLGRNAAVDVSAWSLKSGPEGNLGDGGRCLEFLNGAWDP